jgi:hypothetical protein
MEAFMDLNQARQVVWIGSNRRPLGELLDSGYLTKDRLEWAVANVKNPKVQKAASILLDWVIQNPPSHTTPGPSTDEAKKTPLPGIDLQISLDQARRVKWPFRPYKGEPMGQLVESRKLSVKDLGFAIENAWDEKVRNAAIALTSVRLNQIIHNPEKPKGRLHIISKGRSFSEKRQFQWIMVEGMIYGFFLGIGISYLYYNQFVQEHKSFAEVMTPLISSPTGIFVLILSLCILIGIPLSILLGLDWTIRKINKKIDAYRKGKEGEDKVIEIITGVLDGDWHLFRNITLSERGGDIDSVLVGPPGVWVLEMKAFSGTYRNRLDQWEYWSGKKWKAMKKNPNRQARKNASRLASFFKANGIKQWVTPVIVWANPESPLEVENSTVAIWKLDRLEDELGNIQEDKLIAEADRKKINEKLKKVVESRK